LLRDYKVHLKGGKNSYEHSTKNKRIYDHRGCLGLGYRRIDFLDGIYGLAGLAEESTRHGAKAGP
jgi:hypothetical protein